MDMPVLYLDFRVGGICFVALNGCCIRPFLFLLKTLKKAYRELNKVTHIMCGVG